MKQTRKEICARYYQKNKDKINAKNKTWKLSNLKKIKEAQKIWRENNKDRMKLLVSTWKKDNKEKHCKHNKKYSQNNFKKIKAQQLANKIPLESSCEICNIDKRLERHHWDYNQPLLISTLCKDCHTIQHIKNFGGN